MTQAVVDMGGVGREELDAKVAVICRDRQRTYGELERRTNALAHALVALGVEPLDRVAVMLPNDIELVEAALATAKATAEVVPVNWHLKQDEVAWILADSGAKVLVADAAFAEVVRAASAEAPACKIVTAGAGGDYERLISEHPDTRPDRKGFATPEYFFYTSGTTGRPRGVERDAPDPDRPPAAAALVAMWGFTPDDVYLQAGPMYHAAGAYAFIHLYVGATVVVLPRFDGEAWLAAVAEHGVTSSFMVPAHFIRVLEVPDDVRARYDTSSLRLVLHAAAPCPVAVKQRWLEAFPHVETWEFYGASEGGATRISPKEWLDRPGSVGTPWPGTEIIIRDGAGNPLPPGEHGLIYIKPPEWMARFHYRGDDEKTAKAWRDDAFTVGDIGYVDDEGYLFITDRESDMVIRGGVNIYPAEIEQCLHTHPAVVDCAAFGIPDERLGEVVKAVVEVRAPVAPDDLKAHCRVHLAGFKAPEVVEIVEQLPRDPNGKVLKRLLREQS